MLHKDKTLNLSVPYHHDANDEREASIAGEALYNYAIYLEPDENGNFQISQKEMRTIYNAFVHKNETIAMLERKLGVADVECRILKDKLEVALE